MPKLRLALSEELKKYLEVRTGIKWEISQQLKEGKERLEESISDMIPHGRKFTDIFIKTSIMKPVHALDDSFDMELKKLWLLTAEMAKIASKQEEHPTTPLLFVSSGNYKLISALSNSMELLNEIKCINGGHTNYYKEKGNEIRLLYHRKPFLNINLDNEPEI